MKITPYLLWLNGFENLGMNLWKRVEKGLFSGHEIHFQIEPTLEDTGLWLIRYFVFKDGVACQRCEFCTRSFQDLMQFSEVMARNRYGYSDVDPIEIYVPHTYTQNDWERGDYDQLAFNETTYSYE